MKKSFILSVIVLLSVGVKDSNAMSIFRRIREYSADKAATIKKMVPAGVVGVSVLETAAFNRGKIQPRTFGYNLARNGLLCSAMRNLFQAKRFYDEAKRFYYVQDPSLCNYHERTGPMTISINDFLKSRRQIAEENFRDFQELVRLDRELLADSIQWPWEKLEMEEKSRNHLNNILKNTERSVFTSNVLSGITNVLAAAGKVGAVGLMHKYIRPQI